MVRTRRYRMIRKRRREAVTDYSKRVALLKGGMPRIAVRKSNRAISMQIINFTSTGDKVIAAVTSKELAATGWAPRGNIPTAYLTGLLLAKKAKALNLGELVLDIGLYKPQKSSVIFAAAKGAADGGLKLINQIEFDAKRLSGEHIANYAKHAKQNDTYNKQFSEYMKVKFEAENIQQLFETAKKKIMS